MKDNFIIEGLGGKKTLKGTISVGGAKNAALKVMATSVLFQDKIRMTNVPDIEDVRKMSELLEDMGSKIKKTGKHSYEIDSSVLKHTDTNYELSSAMRASIVLTGPLLAKYKKVSFPHPGGCVIGARPIDLFIKGYKKMGAKVKVKNRRYVITAPPQGLSGAEIFFNLQSVTATETFIMTAVLSNGKTVLKNCALEPEIKSLVDFLNSCGAKIKGVGTSTIEIIGVKKLKAGKKIYKTIPDRIEASSFIILGACVGKKIKVTNCNPEHLDALLDVLTSIGTKIEIEKNSITVRAGEKLKVPIDEFSVKTHEYPGLVTDIQAPLVVLLTQTEGESRVYETIFEGRLAYTQDLVRMGANIKLWDSNRISIKGKTPLRGKELEGPDIRAGLAFVIAAIVAKGKSSISNIYLIDRGYEDIENRLQKIGVKIKRVKANNV